MSKENVMIKIHNPIGDTTLYSYDDIFEMAVDSSNSTLQAKNSAVLYFKTLISEEENIDTEEVDENQIDEYLEASGLEYFFDRYGTFVVSVPTDRKTLVSRYCNLYIENKAHKNKKYRIANILIETANKLLADID